MYVIKVIPLRRGVQLESLSYFSGEKYAPGNILTIPVRNSTMFGVVTDSEAVSGAKTALRAATFSLKKLPAQENVQTLSSAFIQTAEHLAKYYACGIGAVIYALLAPEIRNGEITLPHTHHDIPTEKRAPEILQGNKIERGLAYRSLVRETFAHSGSVLCVVPTSIEADHVYKLLASGIEDRIIILTSTLTKKQKREAYEKLADFSKSKLIIATPSHSVLERHDITTVIVEHSRSPHYKAHVRPYLDYRDVHIEHAKLTGRRLILGDLLPRSEEEYQRRIEVFQTYGETPKRIELPGKLNIVQMNDTPDGKTPFQLFSPEVIEAIEKTKRAKGRTFLFAARRGLAPVVACIDCGFIFRSPESGAPYSLIRTRKNGEEERWFVCGTSGERIRALDTCSECGSWRLRERGIGIQYVHDELMKLLPGTPIILFDHTTANTYKKACFLRDKFENTKGAIMLGTQMALPYLTDNIDTSVVVNMDALYATPTWRLQEENLALLLRLREQTHDTLYIQTRVKSDDLLKEAERASVEHFYHDELELRKTFNYPPFTTFVHLTWQGTEAAVDELTEVVTDTLAGTEVAHYNAPPSPKGVHTRYALIRIAATDWPTPKIVNALKSLPPTVRIVINPDRII